jgi:integrase
MADKNVKFNLKDIKEIKARIIAVFRYDKKVLKYYTKQYIYNKFWNTEKGRAKSLTAKEIETALAKGFIDNIKSYNQINKRLSEIEALITEIHSNYYDFKQKSLSLETFKNELDARLGRKTNLVPSKEYRDFLTFISDYIEAKKGNVPKGSIQVYVKILMHLQGFAKHRRSRFNYEDITKEWFDNFTKYLYAEPRKLSSNYVYKLLQNLKMFMRLAHKEGLHTNIVFEDFSVKRIETTHIFLTKEELKSMYELDLSNNSRLENVRDTFMIGCLTGFRFSDIVRLTKNHIKKIENGKECFEIVEQKTGNKTVVPIHTIVKEILQKHNFQIKQISNQNFNAYIKEIAELAEIKEPVIKVKNIAGKKIEEVFEKWQLVSSHSARRTFATNAYLSGISALSVSQLTNHKSESSFLKYLKANATHHAIQMASNPFFETL